MISINVNSIEQTERIAEAFADNIGNDDVLLLRGDLGAGKTTFTQLIGQKLGVKRRMTSPTFNIIKSYQTGDLNIHHMDCYRLEHSDEDLGFDEYFGNGVVIVEWPDFIEEYLPDAFINITIKHDDDARLFEIENINSNDKIMEALDELTFD